jgi:hypothetical protein
MSFTLPVDNFDNRSSLNSTMLLSVVAIKFASSAEIPKFPYLTLIDYKLLISFVSAFLIIGTQCIEYYLGVDESIDQIVGYTVTALICFVNIIFFIARGRALESRCEKI